MTQTLDLSQLGLDEEFPEQLFVLHHASSGKYACYCHEGIHGVACFSSENGAFRFSEHLDIRMVTIETTFDEAREIAKSRPTPIVSLMLLDKMDEPRIHYIR